jgi:hypothetical protein
LSEAGSSAMRCPSLERDEGSPEGYRHGGLVGPLRFFGPWVLFAFRLWPVRGVICSCVFNSLFLGRGDFLRGYGTLWLSLTLVKET